MPTCHHGRRIHCDWTECGQCVEEASADRDRQEQTDLLKRIAENTSKDTGLQGENQRLRDEIERLKRGR